MDILKANEKEARDEVIRLYDFLRRGRLFAKFRAIIREERH